MEGSGKQLLSLSNLGTRRKILLAAGFLALGLAAPGLTAQGRGGGRGGPPPGPPPTPRAAARIDITSYWVSLITEDWRYRQFTPPKGDYGSVPISDAGRKLGDAWDPVKDEQSGEQCKGYGAAGLIRVPTRLRISWHDGNTLKLESDAGTHTAFPFRRNGTRGRRLSGRIDGCLGLSAAANSGICIWIRARAARRVAARDYQQHGGNRARPRAAMIKAGASLQQIKAARLTADYDTRYGANTGSWTTEMFVEAIYKGLKK
jgi:hypothetical protein